MSVCMVDNTQILVLIGTYVHFLKARLDTRGELL